MSDPPGARTQDSKHKQNSRPPGRPALLTHFLASLTDVHCLHENAVSTCCWHPAQSTNVRADSSSEGETRVGNALAHWHVFITGVN